MIEIGQYVAFLGLCLLVICTPGPDTALTIRNTLAGGRRAGATTAVGVAAGQSMWTVATSAGSRCCSSLQRRSFLRSGLRAPHISAISARGRC